MDQKVRGVDWLAAISPLIVAIVFVACAPIQPVASNIICPVVKHLSRSEQSDLAGALYHINADNPINTILAPDWERMRDESRACGGSQ